MLCFGLPSSNRGLWGSSPFLFIILLIFSDDLEKKLLCGFKLLSISRFLATFPVCSSCCKSSSMLISKTLVSLLKHTLAWESLHSFLYIFLQKYHQLIVRTDICRKRFLLSFSMALSKRPRLFSPRQSNLTVQLLTNHTLKMTQRLRLAGSIISKMADGSAVLQEITS